MYILVYRQRHQDQLYICKKLKYVYSYGWKRLRVYDVTSLSDNWKAYSYIFPICNSLKIIKINKFRTTVFLENIKRRPKTYENKNTETKDM